MPETAATTVDVIDPAAITAADELKFLCQRTRFKILRALATGPSLFTGICRAIGEERLRVFPHLRKLTARGYIRASPLGDRVLYFITPRGMAALEAIEKVTP